MLDVWSFPHWASAINRNQLFEVQPLLDSGADVNVFSRKRSTPLHFASGAGRGEIVEVLLLNGADINLKAQDGSTPLHHAAEGGHGAVVQLLLDNGADVFARNRFEKMPIDFATARGQLYVMALLRRAMARACAAAVAMGQDDRLGAESLLLGVDEGVFQMILDQL